MLFDPERHESLRALPWDAGRVSEAIARIVHDTEAEARFHGWWPQHPRDVEAGEDPDRPFAPLNHGAVGVCWGLHHLQELGAVTLAQDYLRRADELLALNRTALGAQAEAERASFLMGETPIRLWQYGANPDAATADRLAELIAGNVDHPARELMWGSPGTLLAALFLHERSGEPRWAELFRTTAARLWSQLEWNEEHACHFWTQNLYGQQTNYIDATHGFVSVAPALIRGRSLLGEAGWAAWAKCIANTVSRTASWEGGLANWRPWLLPRRQPPMLVQYCHGAPGFIVCLARWPDHRLDTLLLAAGELVWEAGPLTKGPSLCHGTGGNGFALLKLYRRSGDPRWLGRARAFAMHALAQAEAEAEAVGHWRHALWTGDIGLAIFLWHCLHGSADFPTLDVFYAR